MVRRVHLLVGLPTSTTSRLRAGLRQHRQTLAQRGFLVPDDPQWETSVEEIAQWSGPSAVASAELLATLPSAQLHRDVARWGPAELHLVVAVRPMTEVAPSRWAQAVVDGERCGIDQFPAGATSVPGNPQHLSGWDSFDLAEMLERWAQVFPPERIHVLPVGDSEAGGDDLWRRFIDLVDVPGDPLPVPEAVTDPDWGLLQIEVLRRVNGSSGGAAADAERDAWVSAHLASALELPRGHERFRPSAQTWAEWVHRGERAVALLREGRFDVRGELDLLEPRRDLPDWRHPDDVTDEELLRVANRMIAAILTDVRAHNRERFALEAAIAEAAAPPPPGLARRVAARLLRVLRN